MKKPVQRPKKTRDLENTRAEILKATFPLVFKNGFQGVSVDDIVNNTPFTKGAFYHLFPTKMELGYALVDDVIKPMIIDRWIAPLEQYENPLDGILQQMQILIGDTPLKLLKLGCPLNNLVQEMSPIDKGFRLRLQKALNLWIDKMDEHLQRAEANGFLKREIDTREVAHFVVMAHEGFYGMIKGLGDVETADVLMSSFKIYLRAITA